MPAFISQIIEQHPDAGYWHQQYPWFSVGQLVNAANNKDTSAFTKSAQVAAVFFNDIPRLHWLLHQQDVDAETIKGWINTQFETVISQPDTNSTLPQTTKETEAIILYEKEVGEPDAVAVNTIDVIPVETISAETDEYKNKSEEVAQPDSHDTTPQDTLNEMPVEQASHTANQPVEEKIEQALTEVNNSTPPIEIALAEPIVTDIAKAEESEVEETELMPLTTGMLSESLAQAADRFKNAPVDEESLVFKTAYQHTIDYFASQGIKLDVEPAKDDRFGQQLKTFTSWLRQMKRLPDAPVPETDPLVESHAAHSLQTGEVLTEPMADVLLKQGKSSQAIAVLEKLRLLHPLKSHYFAARIQQIKHP